MRETWINMFFQQNFTTFDKSKCKHWITPPRKKLERIKILIFNNENSPHVTYQITLKAKHLFEKKNPCLLGGHLTPTQRPFKLLNSFNKKILQVH
jgi:hypothetical protein